MPIPDLKTIAEETAKAEKAAEAATESTAKARKNSEEALKSLLKQTKEYIAELRILAAMGADVEKKMKQAQDLLRAQEKALRDVNLATQEAERGSKSWVKSLGEVSTRVDTTINSLSELVKVNIEYKIAIQASADALSQIGRASDAQIQSLNQIKDNLKFTREEFEKFQETLREGVDLGIDPKQIENITQQLQRLRGHERGAREAALVVQAEYQAPGAIRTAQAGTEAEFRKAVLGLPLAMKDALRDLREAQTRRGGAAADYSNLIARSNEYLDDIKATLGEMAGKYLYGILLVQLPGLNLGVNKLLATNLSLEATAIEIAVTTKLIATKMGLPVGGGVSAGAGAGAAAGGSSVAGKIGFWGTVAALAGMVTETVATSVEQGAEKAGDKQAAAQAGGVAGLGGVGAAAGMGVALGATVGPWGALAGGIIGGIAGIVMNWDKLTKGYEATFTKKYDIEREAANKSYVAWNEASEALLQTIPSVEAFGKQIEAATAQTEKLPEAMLGRAAGGMLGVTVAGGAAGGDILRNIQVQAAGLRARRAQEASELGGGYANPTIAYEQAQAALASKRGEVPAQLEDLQKRIDEQSMKAVDLVRQGKEGSTEYQTVVQTQQKLVDQKKRMQDDYQKLINAEQTAYTNVEQWRTKRIDQEKEIADLEGAGGVQKQIVAAEEARLAPLKEQARIQRELLDVFGTLSGTDSHVVDVFEARVDEATKMKDLAVKDYDNVVKAHEERLKAIEAQRRFNAAGQVVSNAPEAWMTDEDVKRWMDKENLDFATAVKNMQARMVQGIVENMKATRDAFQGIIHTAEGSKEYQVAKQTRELAQSRAETGLLMGMTPEKTAAVFTDISNQSAAMANKMQSSLPMVLADLNKFYDEQMKRVDESTDPEWAKAEQRRFFETERTKAAIQAETDVENARRKALEDSKRVLTETIAVERRRVETQASILETQKGLAEFLGVSYQTQLSIQQEILRVKAKELQVTRSEMAGLVALMGEGVQDTEQYQNLQRREAQQAAEIMKAAVGVQRDFLDKALGRMFGLAGGTRFQPGAGNREFMNRLLFGEHMQVAGLILPGQAGLAEQRRAMAQGAAAGLANRPIGNVQWAVDPKTGQIVPVFGNQVRPGAPGAPLPANVQPLPGVPGVPGVPGAPGQGLVDITGKIDINITTDDKMFEAKVQKIVISMRNTGVIAPGNARGQV